MIILASSNRYATVLRGIVKPFLFVHLAFVSSHSYIGFALYFYIFLQKMFQNPTILLNKADVVCLRFFIGLSVSVESVPPLATRRSLVMFLKLV